MKQMTRLLFALIALAILCSLSYSQTATPVPSPSPKPSPLQQRSKAPFDLAEYGVTFQADTRLIVMMAALDAAGLETAGPEASVFRTQLRKDLADLDPNLLARLKSFYERNRLPAPATPDDQAARYVSLALTLGQPPTLDAPERSEDLPGGLLEVLDFAPLVREFYRRSKFEDHLVSYTRAYQAEGDRLREPTAEMVRDVLSYLHTRPITVATDRILVKAPATGKKQSNARVYSVREHERRFLILPDLLATPGTINLRVIGDEYYAIVPPGLDPSASELRRAYLQFVIDPLVLRFNKEISERREQIKQVITDRQKNGTDVTPDVFLVVSRSLVAAADARFEEVKRLEALNANTRARLAAATDAATKTSIAQEAQAETRFILDATIARLADDFESGSVLDFFFADQLKGIEESGFDIDNFFPDMIASFDPAREARRPAEYAEARQRALGEKQARAKARSNDLPVYSEAEAIKAATVVKKLSEIEQLLVMKDYNNAEVRLKDLLKDYPRDPRIFFAMAQTLNLAAQDATDETVQSERLKQALSNYRLAIAAASPETDRALISRAHEAMGRIHAFMDEPTDAAKEFDEAIKMGEVRGGAFKEALEGKKRLGQP